MSLFFRKRKVQNEDEEKLEPEQDEEVSELKEEPEEESKPEEEEPEQQEPEKKEAKKPRKKRAAKKAEPKEDSPVMNDESRKLIVEESMAELQKKDIQKPKKQMKIQEKPQPKSQAKAKLKTEEKKWPEPEGQLAVDVFQTDDELVIQSAIAGVKAEALDINVQGDTLTIRGKRESTDEDKNFFYQECYWGAFSREIILPVEADVSRAEATMVDGVLTIRMPKIERAKQKKIVVK